MYRLHLLIPLIILVGLLGGVIALSLIAGRASPRPSPVSSPTTTIRVDLRLSATTLHYGQPVTAMVTVSNTAATTYTYTFPTLCTNPVFLLDGQLLTTATVCGQQLTPVSVGAGQAKTFTLSFEALDPAASAANQPAADSYALPLGDHQLQAAWADRASQGVTINVQR